MKKTLIFAILLLSKICFGQQLSHYKTVIIPLKYDFMKTENQYRLITLTKHHLKKIGFEAFYNNESFPNTNNARCEYLFVNVEQDNGLLVTKLKVVFKDCNGKLVYESETGKSKLKDFALAYSEALENAFVSVEKERNTSLVEKTKSSEYETVAPISNAIQTTTQVNNTTETTTEILYAQPTSTGFQLVDSSPKVVFKLQKTSNPDFFTATKGTIQGVFVQKNKEWFFEYYENEKLVSEKVGVKF